MFQFVPHLQRSMANYMNYLASVTNGLHIRRPKKKANILNETRIKSCIDAGVYSVALCEQRQRRRTTDSIVDTATDVSATTYSTSSPYVVV